MSVPTAPRPQRRTRLAAAVLAATTALVATVVALVPAPASAGSVADSDWLGIVNAYRAMSGLAPVSANATWSAQARDHSCYMLYNGITHDEIPGLPGYTAGGDAAGNSGNVAVSSSTSATARNHIDLWMTGPFHTIGILRYSLTQSGFGLCSKDDSSVKWRSGGTLDVIRGIDATRPRPAQPVVFPGRGATVALNAFITEYPNPMDFCGWTGSAGLPLIAMMPNRVTNASSTLVGPNGPIETCTLHAGNTGSNATARSILDGDHAVIVMPRSILADGTYTVSVDTDGGATSWSFAVDMTSTLGAREAVVESTKPSADAADFVQVDPFRLVDTRKGQGTTRLPAGKVVRIVAAKPDVSAISANFVAVGPKADGHLTIFNCGPETPVVASVVYKQGITTANQAIVPLQDGAFCISSHAVTDLVVDVNGYYRSGDDTARFNPVAPKRLYDSRKVAAGSLAPGTVRKVRVTGVTGGAPKGADAVSLNVTAIKAPADGYLQVYPCDSSASLKTSTINYGPNEARPNTIVVGTDDQGNVCLRSTERLDVTLDFTGYFAQGEGLRFLPLDPIRLFDSRSATGDLNRLTNGRRVRGGQIVEVPVAGVRGIPSDARAAAINITAALSDETLHLTAYPCGSKPDTASLNVMAGQTAANGAMIKLSSTGKVCVFVLKDAHLIVDIFGIWR